MEGVEQTKVPPHIEKKEAEPPSLGEQKAQELLSHIPELDSEESKKLAVAFSDHFKRFPQDAQKRLLDTRVYTPEDAQALWNIVQKGPMNANFEKDFLPLTVDHIQVEPIIEDKKFAMTDEELRKSLFDVDVNLEEKFYIIDKNIPIEQKREVVDQTFEVWRDILKEVPDATLFASSAMYLWGKRMQERGDKETEIPMDFKEPPGDLDAFVKNKESLVNMREVLSKIPGIQFDNNAQFKPYTDGTLALSGYLPIKVNVGGREQVYNHDFEFFTADTNRILLDSNKKTDTVNGIKVLSLEGLKTQYVNNLAFEGRVKRETQAVTDFLAAIGDRELTKDESEKLGLSAEEVTEFQKLQNEFWEEIRESRYSAGKITESMTKLLSGGLKEKVAKRLRNVEAIAGKREDQTTTEEAPLAKAA